MVYQVQKGDTIAKVKDLMNISWDTLRRLNPEALGQSSRSGRWFLRQGAVLRGKEDFEPVLMREKGVQESASEPPAAPVSGEWSEYTIQEGDTLWGLAVKRFHVNVKDLIRDNGIDDPRRLRPGQKIRVRIPSYPEQT
ncbi:MAG: LysM peptidoglycan-binding domain-containing protein, partial [Deltaproteobacteria bacterium]|nr:LysM peptidoglycan-binding domain-containing protein [Deltaproteobacteria bacterium]